MAHGVSNAKYTAQDLDSCQLVETSLSVAVLLPVSFQAAAAKHSQDFVFQSSPTMSDPLGRLPDLLMRLTGPLTEDQISPGSQVRNPQEFCFGQATWWGCPGRKQGTDSKTEQGLLVPGCAGRGKDVPELHQRARWQWGSWDLQTPNKPPQLSVGQPGSPKCMFCRTFGHTRLTAG